MSMIKFPYTNLHELNLDWLIEKVKECYSPDNPPDDVVLSVNGETGNVILYKEANVQLPDVTDTSWNFFRLADGTAVGIKFNKGLPLERVHGSSRFQIYDTGNPPPYPVTSINGQTGDITIQIAFGSLTGDTISFLSPSPDHSWSLDRETLDGAASIRLDTTNDEITAYIEYVSSDETVHSTLKLLTPADIPSESGVISVNGAAGVVVITAEDIQRTGSNAETVEHCLSSLASDTQTLATKIGTVGATSLQSQVDTINGSLADIQEDIGSVGATSLQSQVNTINDKIGTVGATSLQAQIDAINTNLGNVAKRTLISATSTNYTEVYEFPNGMVVLCARITVSVSVTSQSGGIYYGTIAAMDWGYTFADRPTVNVTTRDGGTNGWVWQQNGATTTQTPSLYIGRGTSATGNIVLEFQAIGYKSV